MSVEFCYIKQYNRHLYKHYKMEEFVDLTRELLDPLAQFYKFFYNKIAKITKSL